MAHTYLGAVAAGPSQEGEQSKCPVTLATRGGARARGGGRNKLRACRAHPTLQSHQFTFSQHSGLAAAGFLPTYMSPEVCEPPSARKAFERQGLSALQNTLGLYHKLLLDKKKKKRRNDTSLGSNPSVCEACLSGAVFQSSSHASLEVSWGCRCGACREDAKRRPLFGLFKAFLFGGYRGLPAQVQMERGEWGPSVRAGGTDDARVSLWFHLLTVRSSEVLSQII